MTNARAISILKRKRATMGRRMAVAVAVAVAVPRALVGLAALLGVVVPCRLSLATAVTSSPRLTFIKEEKTETKRKRR